MYHSIIVPLDGSGRTQAALPVAAAIAKASGATLDLVRVHLDDRPDLKGDPSWDGMFRQGELRHLESLALAYESLAGKQVGTALLEPPVVESLIRFGESRADPLFIMVGRGRTGLRRALLGSTADGLVRHGTTPVLVLRDRGPDDPPSWKFERRPFYRIVLPLDGTSHAEGGVPHALAIANALGAKLRLVRVVGPVMTSAVLGAFAMHPSAGTSEAATTRNDIARDYLQSVMDRIAAEGHAVDVSAEVALSTDPATAIIDTCRRSVGDLVVLPTHGRGASRILSGAVGDRILRDGPDAVLFINPTPSPLKGQQPASVRDVSANRIPELVR